ncbi:adenylyl-sulfate kinase [Arthrobacter sp. HY1533]|uniref:adenylyl-sulfate kinase n=1 Tax=Arthrobacter sp. HY1533 TaxID=2970919 RepID=UPI0022B9FCB3|nr:adenylyl-sulfate kinase [Arthrobacter sp. HY1533]
MNSAPGTSPAPPHFALSGAPLDELELLVGGLLAPADGYALPGAAPDSWPCEFTLEVPDDLGKQALASSCAFLTDPDGTPLVRMDVTGKSDGDGGRCYLAGSVATIRAAEHPPARDIRLSSPLPRAGRSRAAVIAVFSAPPLPSELAQCLDTARELDAVPWLIALCGTQPHGAYSVMPLLEQLRAAQRVVADARVGLLVLPAPDGVCTNSGLLGHVLSNLGGDATLDFTTGAAGSSRPAGGTAASVQGGTVIFLTGLSGSGKSTLARALTERLQQDSPTAITLLDGDDVRRNLSPGLGFSTEDREANIRRLGWVATLVSRVGGTVVCAPIAPFESTRKEVRHMAESVGKFVLVHVCTPLEVCEARDRKGLYAKARRGELPGFTGIDSPYEVPTDADFSIDTSFMAIGEAVEKIAENLHTWTTPVARPHE